MPPDLPRPPQATPDLRMPTYFLRQGAKIDRRSSRRLTIDEYWPRSPSSGLRCLESRQAHFGVAADRTQKMARRAPRLDARARAYRTALPVDAHRARESRLASRGA